MTISYHELNPKESEIELKSINFVLRKFDLSAQVWAYNNFATDKQKDGVKVLSERIQDLNDFGAVIEVVWHLLKNKMHFNNNIEYFKAAIELEDYPQLKIMQFRESIVECLGVSQPKLNEIKEDIELKKSLTAAN